MKRITKKDRRRLSFVCGFLLFLFSVLIWTVYKDWIQIINNKKQAVFLAEKYNKLLKEENSLESEVNKLQDPEYVARYAREKYLLSKDGELIIRIPMQGEE